MLNNLTALGVQDALSGWTDSPSPRHLDYHLVTRPPALPTLPLLPFLSQPTVTWVFKSLGSQVHSVSPTPSNVSP